MELGIQSFASEREELNKPKPRKESELQSKGERRDRNIVRESCEERRRREDPDSVSRFLEDGKVELELSKFRIRAKGNESAQTTLGERVAKHGGAKRTEQRQRR